MIDYQTCHHALLCLFVKYNVIFTETFTFLLYETSNTSIKKGYYQLRLVLGNFTVVAYDAVTKKVEWSWHISHIRGYSNEKSGIKVEVGKYVYHFYQVLFALNTTNCYIRNQPLMSKYVWYIGIFLLHRKAPVNGTFCFTGKQIEFFCEQIKMFGRNYAKRRSQSLPAALPG